MVDSTENKKRKRKAKEATKPEMTKKEGRATSKLIASIVFSTVVIIVVAVAALFEFTFQTTGLYISFMLPLMILLLVTFKRYNQGSG